MTRLNSYALRQMNRGYFQSLSKARLVEVAENLPQLAVEQWEKINSNSSNSSQPPSRDNPFQKSDSSPTTISESSQARSNANSSAKKVFLLNNKKENFLLLNIGDRLNSIIE